LSDFFGVNADIDEKIGNISLGQKKTITLSAADAFGERNLANVIIENRTSIIANMTPRDINRTFSATPAIFKQVFGEDAVLNKEYSANQLTIWDTKVIGISSDSIKISIENKPGENLSMDQAIFLQILSVTSDKIRIKFNAEETTVSTQNGNYSISVVGNDIIAKWMPQVGQEITYGYSLVKVLSFNDTAVVLDANGPYAGQTVTIELKAVKIISKKQSAVDSSTCYGKYGIGPDTIVFAYADWCPHCQNMHPVVNSLKEKGYDFFLTEEKDASFAVVDECLGGLGGGFPAFICAKTGEKINGDSNANGELMKEADLIALSEKCKSSQSVSQSTTPKSDKPNLELFVWSFCPGGVSGESVVKPVSDLLKDKINAKVLFIGPVTTDKAIAAQGCFAGQGKSVDDGVAECCLTKQYSGKTYYSCALHNNKDSHLESEESERQACIQKKYGASKYFEYVSAFNANCWQNLIYGKSSPDKAAFESCWKAEVGKIGSVAEIQSCMDSNEGFQILIDDTNYGDSLGGVHTSPSFFVNGKEVSPSSSDSLKQSVCNSFNTIPSECSQTVQSTGTQSSGGCGA
jgi:FKBP-type peptidyl-prolyl cis-trans isomerase 2